MLSLCTTVHPHLHLIWLHFSTHMPLVPYQHSMCVVMAWSIWEIMAHSRDPFVKQTYVHLSFYTNSVLVFLDGFVLSPWQEDTYCFMGDKYIFHVVQSKNKWSSNIKYSTLLLVGLLKFTMRMFWRMKHLLWQWTPKNPLITRAKPKGLFWGNEDPALQPDSWCDDWILMKW